MQGIPDSHLYRLTNNRCRIGTVFSPDGGHIVARNTQRKAINTLRKILHQFGSIYKSNFLLWTQHFDRGCICNPSVSFDDLCRLRQMADS